MLALLRRKQILEELRAKGGVRLTELSEELSVSEMTIRQATSTRCKKTA